MIRKKHIIQTQNASSGPARSMEALASDLGVHKCGGTLMDVFVWSWVFEEFLRELKTSGEGTRRRAHILRYVRDNLFLVCISDWVTSISRSHDLLDSQVWLKDQMATVPWSELGVTMKEVWAEGLHLLLESNHNFHPIKWSTMNSNHLLDAWSD